MIQSKVIVGDEYLLKTTDMNGIPDNMSKWIHVKAVKANNNVRLMGTDGTFWDTWFECPENIVPLEDVI